MKTEKYYSVQELAKLLNVSEWMISNQMKKGRMPAVRIGGQWRMSESALDEYMQEQSNQYAKA